MHFKNRQHSLEKNKIKQVKKNPKHPEPQNQNRKNNATVRGNQTIPLMCECTHYRQFVV